MSKLFLLLIAVAIIVLASTPSQGSGAQQTTPKPAIAPTPVVEPAQPVPMKNPVKPTAESQAKAKSLYQIDCAVCHGDNGNGKTDVATTQGLTLGDWTDPKTLSGKEDWELFNLIRNGKGTTMPSEPEGRARDAEVWNLIVYIRSLSKPQPPAPAAAAK